MRISSFNINKFQGAYSNINTKGGYYNPRNINFKTHINSIVNSLLKDKDDIIFLQEFYDKDNLKSREFFINHGYAIYNNIEDKYDKEFNKCKSHVVAITLKESPWKIIKPSPEIELQNKFVVMELEEKSLKIISFHNTDDKIRAIVETEFKNVDKQIILGDFNNKDWIEYLNSENFEYRDLITDDMITFKPAQTAIDRIFVTKEYDSSKIVFNGVIETYASDHNILTFLLTK